MDQQETFWQWRTLEKDRRGREKWRTLGWRMCEADANAWAAMEGTTIEKVPGSGEERAGGGGYVGWGQALEEDPGAPAGHADEWPEWPRIVSAKTRQID